MERGGFIALIDGIMARRATITRRLSARHLHVEPFETMAELAENWPRTGLILAHDGDGVIAALIEHMGLTGDWLPVVGFAEQPAPRQIVEAVLDGAVDYLAWPFDEREVFAAFAAANTRAEGLGNAKLREARARSRIAGLTRREREVLVGVASGLPSRKIGENLAISPRTVEIHRANLLRKIGARHTSEAIRVAIEAALV